MTKAQIEDIATILTFIWAGNAIITLVSKATGQRYTFKISRAEDNGSSSRPYFVALLTNPDNNSGYTYLGLVPSDGLHAYSALLLTKASKLKNGSTPVRAFRYFLSCLDKGKLEKLEVWHEGKCGRCGRRLTVPESIASGLGPVCAGMVAK